MLKKVYCETFQNELNPPECDETAAMALNVQNINTVFKKYHLKLNTGQAVLSSCTILSKKMVQLDKCHLYAVCLLLQKSELGMASFPCSLYCSSISQRSKETHVLCSLADRTIHTTLTIQYNTCLFVIVSTV